MSRQCDARIQIATSRSLELDPEFAASMFYCVRDPLHEGPHWITMPSKSESARDEKAVTDHVTRGVVSDGGRTSPPVSASNTRADPKPCLRCARYGVKAIEGHT